MQSLSAGFPVQNLFLPLGIDSPSTALIEWITW